MMGEGGEGRGDGQEDDNAGGGVECFGHSPAAISPDDLIETEYDEKGVRS